MTTAVITGGSGGIGLACGRAFTRRDYDVILVAREPKALDASARSIGARWLAADCTDDGQFRKATAAIESVDVLVHAAGALGGTFLSRETAEGFDDVVRANLRSAFVVVSALMPKLAMGARVIFLTSMAATDAMRGLAAYSGAKAGVEALARVLREEVRRDGVRVHVVSPGPVATSMLGEIDTPLHCLDADDVAAAVDFLASLPAHVDLPTLELRAATSGPLARPPHTAHDCLTADLGNQQ